MDNPLSLKTELEKELLSNENLAHVALVMSFIFTDSGDSNSGFAPSIVDLTNADGAQQVV